ncbi:LOW QUALITY PROTEIN: DNA-directed RNA polymerase I subunit RPA12 [Porphyrio hochstetteri]
MATARYPPSAPFPALPLAERAASPRGGHAPKRRERGGGGAPPIFPPQPWSLPPSRFQSCLEFCPECGSVLPRPGAPTHVRCPRCAFALASDEFEGKTIRSTIEFNRLQPPAGRGTDAAPHPEGPLVERRCPRCGHEGMAYHTRQMRSADEGQTVFYTCPRCRLQEKEDS